MESSTALSSDTALRNMMLNGWAFPERRKWRIEYRAIEGLEQQYSWHVEDTQAWVRIYPEVFSLEELNKESRYELDAVALNQNYGVIDFYVYAYPQEIASDEDPRRND